MTPANPWTLTLRQYERAIMDDCVAQNPGIITKAEYLRLYPNDCRLSEWIGEIDTAVSHKESIPARVLDDVFRRSERSGWAFLKLMNAYETVPSGYLPPQTRMAQAARRAEKVVI